MRMLQLLDLRRGKRAPGLPQQRGHEEAAAHADPPVDAPHRQVDAERGQRRAPREHVLVDAVDQRAVEIEEERGRRCLRVQNLLGHVISMPYRPGECPAPAAAGEAGPRRGVGRLRATGPGSQMRYSLTVTGSPPSPEEIRAAAEIHRELGPEYDKAVVESFLERLGPEIDARVDARVAQVTEARAAQPRGRSLSPAGLALGSIGLGIPITAIVATSGAHPGRIRGRPRRVAGDRHHQRGVRHVFPSRGSPPLTRSDSTCPVRQPGPAVTGTPGKPGPLQLRRSIRTGALRIGEVVEALVVGALAPRTPRPRPA